MKKYGLLLLFMIVSLGLWGAEPTVSTSGIASSSGGNGSSDSIAPEGTVYVKFENNDLSSMGSASGTKSIVDVHEDWTATESQIVLLYFDSSDTNIGSSYRTIDNFSWTAGTGTFTFTMPAHTSDLNSTSYVTVYFGLKGKQYIPPPPPPPTTNYFTGTGAYTDSDGTDFWGTEVSAPANYATQLTYAQDDETDAPTLTMPEDGSSDNATIDVQITIPEAASSGTVKLYIDDDTTHTEGNIWTTLTLHSDYESASVHSFVLDATSFSGDSDVSSVSPVGNNSLSTGTYYFRLGYQDANGNDETQNTDGWHEFTYDTSATAGTVSSVSNEDDGTFIINYNLPEAAEDNTVTFYINDTSDTKVSYFTVDTDSLETAGNHSTTIDATGISSSDDWGAWSGSGNANTLSSGTSYRISMIYTDAAGNTATESGYQTLAYEIGATDTPTLDSVSQNTDVASPQLHLQYDFDEAATNRKFWVYIDAAGDNDKDGDIAKITIEGNTTSGDNKTLDLNCNTSGNFTAVGDSDIFAVTQNSSLADGTTYFYTIGYQDGDENPEAKSSSISFAWDGETEQPSISKPLNTTYTDDVTFNVTIPETAYGSLELIITNTTTSATETLTLTGVTSEVDFVISGSNFSGDDNVSATTGNFNALTLDDDYTAQVRYQDQYGNAVSTSDASASFTFDNETGDITSWSSPAAGGSTATSTIAFSFNIPEAMSYIDIDFVGQNEAGDSTTHTVRLSGTALNGAGTLTFDVDGSAIDTDDPEVANLTLTRTAGTNVLTVEETYDITLRYSDASGNTESSVTHAGFEYQKDTTTTDPTWDGDLSDNRFGPNDDIGSIQFTLPEPATTNTVFLRFKDALDGSNLVSMRLTPTYETAVGHTLSLNDADGNGDYTDDADVESQNGSFSNGTTYYLQVEYQDDEGNAAASTSTAKSFTYDNVTASITFTDPANNAYSSDHNIEFDFTTAEDMSELQIDFIGQGTVARENLREDRNTRSRSARNTTVQKEIARDSSTHTIDLTGSYLTAGTHSFTLDGRNLASLANMTVPVGTISLTDEETYTIRIRCTDETLNDEVTAQHTGFEYYKDLGTETPTWTGNLSDTYFGPSRDIGIIQFTLPEPASSGTVYLRFKDGLDGTNLISMQLSSSYENEASYTFSITDTDNDGFYNDDNAAVSSQNAAFSNGTTYYLQVEYQDDQGNAAASTSTAKSFTYDSSATDITIDAPPNSSTQSSTFNIQFDLPEDAATDMLKLSIACTSTSETDRVITFNDDDDVLDLLSQGNNKVISFNPADITLTDNYKSHTGSPSSLTSGQQYTFTFTYTDLAANTSAGGASAQITALTYQTGVQISEISDEGIYTGTAIADVDAVTIDTADWQPVSCFKVSSNGDNHILTSMTVNIISDGTAFATTDVESNGIALIESADATLDASDDIIERESWDVSASYTFTGSYSEYASSGMYYFFAVDLTSNFDETKKIKTRVPSSGYTAQTNPGAAGVTENSASGYPLDTAYRNIDSYITFADDATDIETTLVPGTDNQPFFGFSTIANFGTTTISAVKIDLSDGSAVSGDFESDGLQLYTSSSNSFAAASAVGNTENYADGVVTFDGLSEAITTSKTYFWLTADVAAGANTAANAKAKITDSTANVTESNSWDNYNGLPITGGTATLPVELSSVEFSNTGRKIMIQWTTQTETENSGFNIYRGLTSNALESGQVIKLNGLMIGGAGNSSQPRDYDYEDDYRIEYNQPYFYWLETIDFNGYTEFTEAYSFTATQEDADGQVPFVLHYGLAQNYPNPFNPDTQISFRIKESVRTQINVYNTKGQFVKKIYDSVPAAEQLINVHWNGTNELNKEVAAGVYFYRIKNKNMDETKRMLLLK